jgi:hypothetical protein
MTLIPPGEFQKLESWFNGLCGNGAWRLIQGIVAEGRAG